MSYKRILIAVDGSENSPAVAKKGFELANQLNAEVGLLFVVDTSATIGDPEAGIMPEVILSALRREAAGVLDELIRENNHRPDTAKFMPEGYPKEEILDTAATWNADLIVVGMRGKSGFSLFIMGSIAQHTMLHAKVPVMVVPAKKE